MASGVVFWIAVIGGASGQVSAREDVETLRREAVIEARAGRHEEALATLRGLLTREPSSVPVRRDLGVVLAWSGECEAALEILRPLVDAGEEPPWVISEAAACLLRRDRADEAARMLETAMAGSEDSSLGVVYASVLESRGESDRALEVLNEVLERDSEDVRALKARAALHERRDSFLQAFRDASRVVEIDPADDDAVRMAASELLALGAVEAAERFLSEHELGPEGETLARQVAGDRAARHIRWGWAEPVFGTVDRRHEAERAIAILEEQRGRRPEDRRAVEDLLLAYRLADRMEEVVELWESVGREGDPPHWARNAAADAYLYLGRTEEARTLYASIAEESPERAEGYVGLFWAAVEDRRFEDAEAMLERLESLPGRELDARIQRGWLLLFGDRTRAAQRHFEELFRQYPGDVRVREGLATSYLWQGWPRRGLERIQDVLTRTTLQEPFVDRPSARIAEAGGRVAVGELGLARREAADLIERYPENQHVQRLARDVDTALSPEVRLDARYDTSDRGLEEGWLVTEVSVPIGTRVRLAAGTMFSRSSEESLELGDTEAAFVGLSLRAARWLQVSHEVAIDISGTEIERDPAQRTRLGLFAGDRWRFDLAREEGTWTDLPLRGRALGLGADSWSGGISYNGGALWNARLGGGISDFSDGNERTWGLAAAEVQARTGPRYHAAFGLELYGSENSDVGAPYFNPLRDRSFSLTHRSEWVTHNAPTRRHTFSLLLHAGTYDQEGFDTGAVGGAWIQSSSDFGGRTALIVGAGARSQLYDGSRELDPRVYLTLRRRF